LGKFAANSARQAVQIYSRASRFRQELTCLLAWNLRQPGAPTEGEIRSADEQEPTAILIALDANTALPEEGQGAEAYRQALQATLHNSNELLRIIKSSLYEMRSHDRLIRAGWDGPDILVNLYLLLDAGDPVAAGAFFPLLSQVIEAAVEDGRCRLHLLIQTASFPSEYSAAGKQSADPRSVQIYAFLEDLEDFLKPNAASWQAIRDTLYLGEALLPDIDVYLCDSRKEGAAVVGASSQMSTLFGNTLLTMLEPGAASLLHDAAARDGRVLFHTVGAAALSYDPESFLRAAAEKAGAAFVDERIMGGKPDAQKSSTAAHEIHQAIGTWPAWLTTLLPALEDPLLQPAVHPESGALTILFGGFTLPPLDWLNPASTPWAAEVEKYENRFNADILPTLQSRFEEPSEDQKKSLLDKLHVAVDKLPRRSDLYPNIATNAAVTLETLSTLLDEDSKNFAAARQQFEARSSVVQRELEENLESLQKLLKATPSLPILLKLVIPHLPPHWGISLATLYYAWRKRFSFTTWRMGLEMAHKNLQRLLEEKLTIRVWQEMIVGFDSLHADLLNEATDAKKRITEWEQKIKETRAALHADWPAFPLGQEENGWEPLYRLPALGRVLADYLFNQHTPHYTDWMDDLLAENGPFKNWPEMLPTDLQTWILHKGQEVYETVRNVDLEEIFKLMALNVLKDLEVPFTVAGQPVMLEPALLNQLQAAALPPLRADFNIAEGAGDVVSSNYSMTGKDQWQQCRAPERKSDIHTWRSHFTGDPYTALFVQARHNFPPATLVDMKRQNRFEYEKLSEQEQQARRLLPALSIEPLPPMPLTVDPHSPDTQVQHFEWTFRLKGSKKEYKQSLDLAISKTRYRLYKRRPRQSGNWNHYAEEDMPEIRVLSAAFARLQAEHPNWSSYSAALHVLQFVQACIPYKYDIDTTGYEDWARYPIETLMERTGDCEDVAILCAAVIARMGFPVVLLLYPRHLAFGVGGADKLKGDYVVDEKTGMHYFYGEATSKGWLLGQIPESYRGRQPDQILPVRLLMEERDDEDQDEDKEQDGDKDQDQDKEEAATASN